MTTPQDSRATMEQIEAGETTLRTLLNAGAPVRDCAEQTFKAMTLASRPSAAASGDDELVNRLVQPDLWKCVNPDGTEQIDGAPVEAAHRIEALTRAQPLGGDER